MINSDICGLYLVQLCGLWGSSSLQHNLYLPSYAPLSLLLYKAMRSYIQATHTLPRQGSNKYINKKEEKGSASLLGWCHFIQHTVLQTRKWELKHQPLLFSVKSLI